MRAVLAMSFLGLSLAASSVAHAAPMLEDAPEKLPTHEVVAASPVPMDVRLGGHFGMRTGRTGARQFHAGVDFAAPRGTAVFSVADGVVAHVSHDSDRRSRFSGYGNAIVVYHPTLEVWTLYAHLSEIAVEEGETVQAGTRVGLSGASTNGRFPGMGAHLHFEVRHRARDGREPFPGAYGPWNEDPEAWLAERGVVYGRGGVLDVTLPELAAEGSEDVHTACDHDHEDVLPEPETSAMEEEIASTLAAVKPTAFLVLRAREAAEETVAIAVIEAGAEG